MTLSIRIKTLIASCLHSAGIIDRRIRSKGGSAFVILMYHRIIPEEDAKRGVQSGMYVSPSTFEDHLLFLRKHFSMKTLEEISGYREGGASGEGKPWCALTFDDGWSDFYDNAFPLLMKYEVPATVFLPTDYIGTDKVFWTDRLVNLFYGLKKDNHYTKQSVHPLVDKINKFSGPLESKIERSIELLKEQKEEVIEKVIDELSYIWDFHINYGRRAFLSWEEVKDMYRTGLITFGSHTAGHKILTTISTNEVIVELERSKEKLLKENVVNSSSVPFCYPNGNYTSEIAELVKKAGYSLAVTTDSGWNRIENGSHSLTLKRIAVHQDVASKDGMFGCRITGIF